LQPKTTDISEKVALFFETENLFWNNVCECCTNGTPAMMGSRSGFQVHLKNRSPNVKCTHCMIHRQALASKTLPVSFATVLEQVIKFVNFIKGGALNLRLFKQLCIDMDANHNLHIFHTNV